MLLLNERQLFLHKLSCLVRLNGLKLLARRDGIAQHDSFHLMVQGHFPELLRADLVEKGSVAIPLET
ncbi:hypothetical protein A2U01_0073912, partial [Trifolium medium]|nr:hypothetical protein [Trifolium medium]